MTQTPSYYVNSPVSGTQYNAPAGYWFIPSGASWTVTAKAWSGANGTGSLVTVSNLTAYNYDETTASTVGSFNGGTANTSNSNQPSTTDTCSSGGSFSGGSAPGSLEIFCVYTGSAVVPNVTSLSPNVGGIGTSVTITGTHFTGATSVKFNGTSASFSVTNDTTISATVPSGATTGAVSVSNPSGTGTTQTFTVSGAWVNTGTPGSPVWTAASLVAVNTGTPGSPVWTTASFVGVNTGTPGSPVWTPGG